MKQPLPNLIIRVLVFVCLSVSAVRCSVQFETVSVGKILSMIQSGQSCVSIIQDFLDRITQFNKKSPSINAFITINVGAVNQANALDTYYASSGNISGSFHCVPVLIKDNIDVCMLVA